MLNEQQLYGLFVPVVTPFLPDGALDLNSFASYAGGLAEKQIQGLIINGTTGESPTVTWDEVKQLVQEIHGIMRANRVPLVIGTGTNSTASTVQRTELAGKLGADAVLVVVPYYNRPSQEGIIEHYRAVAQVGIPVIAYEIPARTGVRLTVESARRILDIDGVIGMKDCSGDMELITELTRLGSKPILCGDDHSLHTMLNAGASGGILASANVMTDSFIEVLRYAEQGSCIEAKDSFDRLLPLIRLLFKESNPAPLKWLLHRQGLIASDTVRLPLTPISSPLRQELEQALIDNVDKLSC